ncbi:MAG: type III polyketide synthase [Planctomycetes bacterium]|nr:type III polyketide synthase [Planctomycetota bacterium]
MRIAAVASALPMHVYDQATLVRYLREVVWPDRPELLRRLDALYSHLRVERRHLALPLERYLELRDFTDCNNAWITAATDLAERALTTALSRARLAPADIDAVVFTTVTGVASPSIDARLVNRVGLRPDVKRLPLFGLGCVAGAAAIARAADLVRGDPRAVVAVISVELCSLTVQRDDPRLANVIATGLFGDGAGCVLVVGREHHLRGPEIVATRSVFYPDTEQAMGWQIGQHGFRIVLSPDVPRLAREHLGPDVDAFLAPHGLARRDIATWICHPGGPKVLEGARDSLGLTDADLELSWESLRTVGNLSSASVLLILEQTLARGRPAPGQHALLLAMGPGFCSELLLLTG